MKTVNLNNSTKARNLVELVKNNRIIDLVKTIRSGYEDNYHDGDSDFQVEGFSLKAKIGDISTDKKHICVERNVTPSHLIGYGRTQETFWALIEDVQGLDCDSIAISNLNLYKDELDKLSNIKADWTILLKGHKYYCNDAQYSEMANDDYYSFIEKESHIEIWHEHDEYRQSFKALVCAVNFDGIDITEKVKKSIKKANYFSRVKELHSKGLNSVQAHKFLSIKAYWKYEEVELKIALIKTNIYPKDLFTRLSDCNSHREFNSLCEKWALDFVNASLPRKTAYAGLISELKN